MSRPLYGEDDPRTVAARARAAAILECAGHIVCGVDSEGLSVCRCGATLYPTVYTGKSYWSDADDAKNIIRAALNQVSSEAVTREIEATAAVEVREWSRRNPAPLRSIA